MHFRPSSAAFSAGRKGTAKKRAHVGKDRRVERTLEPTRNRDQTASANLVFAIFVGLPYANMYYVWLARHALIGLR
jgi:hypothetical protein